MQLKMMFFSLLIPRQLQRLALVDELLRHAQLAHLGAQADAEAAQRVHRRSRVAVLRQLGVRDVERLFEHRDR